MRGSPGSTLRAGFGARVTSVDLDARQVFTGDDAHPYDYLVLACGARHAYFGHEEWEPFAPGLKTLEQATEIRRRVLTAFEEAEKETDPAKQKALLTFAIVGGGPTGVELAGAIGEMSRFTLARAVRDLESLGVQVWTASPVTRIDAHGVEIGDERVRCATALWAAGVEPSPLGSGLGVPLDRQGRPVVRPDLSLPGHPEAFVAGDQACAAGPDGTPLPGLAPVALQQGQYLAKLIRADLSAGAEAGGERAPFHYVDRGQLATIGRSRAVLEYGRLRAAGLAAWLLWLAVHIYYLVGFKNRVFVVLQWAWAYLRFRRGARLIIDKEWRFYGRDG